MGEIKPKNEKGDLVASTTQRARKDIFVSFVSQSETRLQRDSAFTGAGLK